MHPAAWIQERKTRAVSTWLSATKRKIQGVGGEHHILPGCI
jgi:hypothetical protein